MDYNILVWIVLALSFVLIVLFLKNKKGNSEPTKSMSEQDKEKLMIQKGIDGELATRKILEALPFNNVVLGNVYIPKKQGMEQTQVDLICITEKAIFVIENKNYSGRVYFDRTKGYKDWIYYVGKNKYTFFSPEKQNEVHINALANIFKDIGKDKMISLIVFGDKSDLSNVQRCKKHIVINQKELSSTIKAIHSKSTTSFTQKQMTYYSNLISPFVDESEERRIEHSKNFATTKK